MQFDGRKKSLNTSSKAKLSYNLQMGHDMDHRFPRVLVKHKLNQRYLNIYIYIYISFYEIRQFVEKKLPLE